jgi:hypothetical protein
MPFNIFLDNMNSNQMRTAHKVLEDMLKRDHVTREDVDNAFDKEARRGSMAGIG